MQRRPLYCYKTVYWRDLKRKGLPPREEGGGRVRKRELTGKPIPNNTVNRAERKTNNGQNLSYIKIPQNVTPYYNIIHSHLQAKHCSIILVSPRHATCIALRNSRGEYAGNSNSLFLVLGGRKYRLLNCMYIFIQVLTVTALWLIRQLRAYSVIIIIAQQVKHPLYIT